MFTKCIFLSGVVFIVIINIVDYLQYGSDFCSLILGLNAE